MGTVVGSAIEHNLRFCILRNGHSRWDRGLAACWWQGGRAEEGWLKFSWWIEGEGRAWQVWNGGLVEWVFNVQLWFGRVVVRIWSHYVAGIGCLFSLPSFGSCELKWEERRRVWPHKKSMHFTFRTFDTLCQTAYRKMALEQAKVSCSWLLRAVTLAPRPVQFKCKTLRFPNSMLHVACNLAQGCCKRDDWHLATTIPPNKPSIKPPLLMQQVIRRTYQYVEQKQETIRCTVLVQCNNEWL